MAYRQTLVIVMTVTVSLHRASQLQLVFRVQHQTIDVGLYTEWTDIIRFKSLCYRH